KKYKRVGHLFQDRYRSQVVEEDSYMLSLTKYIHRNPIKAGIVTAPKEYRWSSYNSYLGNDNNFHERIINTDIVLGLLAEDADIATARRKFIEFMNEDENESYIDLSDYFIDLPDNIDVLDEKEAREIFDKMIKEEKYNRNENIEAGLNNDFLKEFRKRTKLSIRSIAAITGINKDKINKILNGS
ncbi:MAG: hypothetical protein Q7J78_04405, partial [Clostridiales bacterium]|nr:hypothetical protein [Clostridiales bacterium]